MNEPEAHTMAERGQPFSIVHSDERRGAVVAVADRTAPQPSTKTNATYIILCREKKIFFCGGKNRMGFYNEESGLSSFHVQFRLLVF